MGPAASQLDYVCLVCNQAQAASWNTILMPEFRVWHDQLRAVALCGCLMCRMENLAATQNKLMMRLTQLRATEALFCDLAATCPAAAQQLPDLSYPLTTAAAGASRPGLSSSHQAAGGASGGGKAHAAGRWGGLVGVAAAQLLHQ